MPHCIRNVSTGRNEISSNRQRGSGRERRPACWSARRFHGRRRPGLSV